ncbi:hypothetical protein IscW_ISCW014553, partial [Ixodes scapularis]
CVIILMALVDHRYRFRYVNVGKPGRCHNAHVFGRSALAKSLEGPTDCIAAAGFLRPSLSSDVQHAEAVRTQECHGKVSIGKVEPATVVSTKSRGECLRQDQGMVPVHHDAAG